jgi:acetyl esterase/lipase
MICMAAMAAVMPYAAQAQQQAPSFMRELPQAITPASEPSIVLGAGGKASDEMWAMFEGGRMVRNVTQAAIYPVRPAPGKANGTAIVIAPGGAFLALSFDSEGMQVAHYLAEQGVTSFVLKYRLDPTPKDGEGFGRAIGARVTSFSPTTKYVDMPDSAAQRWGQEDGLAAIKWVRSHAGEYGVRPDRIGMIGFSAGGMTTMNVLGNYDSGSRPDFAAVIYGASTGKPLPKDLPPLFIALAADDPLLGYASVPIFDAWRAAGKPVEMHVYQAGSHGFGMRKVGGTAEQWPQHFSQWLKANGLL